MIPGIIDIPTAAGGGGAAPSSVPIYKGVLYDAVNRSSYTFTGKDIGVAHAKRIVILAMAGDDAGFSSISIGGVAASEIVLAASGWDGAPPTRSVQMAYAVVPAGTTADITINLPGAVTECFAYYWIAYPDTSTPVDAAGGSDQGAPANPASADNIQTVANGFLVGAGFGATTPTPSWSGGGTATLSGTQSGTSIIGKAITVTGTTALTTGDLSSDSSGSGKDGVTGASWGATT